MASVYNNIGNRVNMATMDTLTDTTNTTNRDKTVVKTTHELQSSTPISSTLTTVAMPELTAQEIKFSSLVAQGYTLTKAYRLAFPNKAHINNDTVRVNSSRLLAKDNITQEVAIKRKTLSNIARLAEDRITETLTEGKQGSKSLTDTMLAMYEHANGKAKQTTEVISSSISVNIDLTGKLTEVEN